MSAFDRDFAPVEETVILDDVTFKLIESFDPSDETIRKEHRLLVVTPDGQETAYPVRGEVTIGRSEDNHIVLKEDRSVSSRHMAVNTDGQLFWYQDLESRHGTFINGERQSEGWLVGSEEIIIGNSRVYFLLPEIEVPAELEEAERKFEEEAAAAAAAEEVGEPEEKPEGEVPPEEEPVSNFAVFLSLFVLLLAVGGGAYWYLYLKNDDVNPVAQVTDAAVDKGNQLNRALELYQKSQKHLKAREWKEADRLLKLAASEIPEGNPLRARILTTKAQVARELYAAGLLKRAKELYWDKPAAAIQLLHKFPDKTSLAVDARKLKERIYKKEITPRLEQLKAFIETRKCEKAKETLKQVLGIDKKLQKTWAGKVENCSKEDPAIVIKSSSRRKRYGRRRRGASSIAAFKRGLSMYRSGQYTQAWIFFRRQSSSAQKSWLRRRASKYSRAVKSFQRNYNAGRSAQRRGSASRALSAYLRALRADRTLGGGRSRLIKPYMGKLYYQRGERYFRSKSYLAAFRDYKRARGYGYSRASSGIAKVRRKAMDFFKQAEALKGIADDEAKRMYRKVVQILPSSHPLARRARQNL
jgi:hypothetical protein